jgi:hypothetical protein
MTKDPGKLSAEFKWGLRTAWLIGILVFVGWILAIGFGLPKIDEFLLGLMITAGTIMYTVLALLIIKIHPLHTVGWLFIISGFIGSLILLGAGLINWGSQLDTEIAHGLITWFNLQVQPPWTLITITLVLLFFPDGHLPSPRWKPVLILVVISILYTQASPAFSSWATLELGPFDVDNPIEIPGNEIIFMGPIGTFFEIFRIIAILGCLAAVIVRFIHSKGIERMQMKWLVYSAVLVISLIMVLLILGVDESAPEVMWYTSLISPALLALSIGVAILRYRLFDIDVIIRRTLQYTLLTGLLVLVYFGIVVLLQGLVENLTGEQSPIVIVISTLAIAALFNPLRNRVQDFIDRRFYRKKYDAEQTLARFAEVARDEVEMEKLTAVLLGVVAESMEPESVSVWLQGPEVHK